MKELKVLIKDKNTLVLLENANEGDYIDLSSLNTVDYTNIEEAIDNAKDIVYQKKLSELEKQLLESKNHEIKDLNNHKEYELKEMISKFNLEKEQLTSLKDREIIKLKQEIDNLNNIMKINLENEKLKIKDEYQKEISSLKQEIESNKSKLINELLKKDIEYSNKLKEKEDTINNLQRQKASLNVKQTGEDLEAWCDNEVKSYMQNGLFNCTWEKDNIVIKNEEDSKGSKADFIYKVYSSPSHNVDELLTSVCLEMKDENPDSVNKKTNADYFKQLDKNRNKKNCKYALLVSNLELDKPNDLPIYRVNEYQDMYVVRPAYMMTFLNLITSLTNRFVELITKDKNAQIELKNTIELNEEFNKLKNTYLDKPLESLSKNIETIRKNNENIIKASKTIDDTIDTITKNYLNVIETKLSTFEIKINKAYKRNK